MKRNPLPLALLVLALFASQVSSAGAATSPVDSADLDPAVPSCTDFFQHATGGWQARHPIPAAEASWGRFNEVAQRNREALRGILEAAAAKPGATGVEGQVGAFYASCLGEAAIEAKGLEPIRQELERIAAVSDLPSLQSTAAHLHLLGVRALFGVEASQDLRDSSHMILAVVQGGLGLPDRDFYFKDDEATKKVRDEYVGHVARMLELSGEAPETAAREAAAVMALETRLAGASKTRAERRDTEANYHKLSLAEMGRLTPHFSWERYLRDLGAVGVTAADVHQPEYLQVLDGQLATAQLADWRAYLRWHLLRATAEALPARLATEHFRFEEGILQGIQESRPRWDRCVRSTDRNLGMALGRLYAEKTFPPEAKARARAMVDQILAALRDDLATLPWMDAATRAAAERKLAAVAPKIGYPDRWIDYSSVAVARDAYGQSFLHAKEFEVRRQLAKVGKPVDRTEWGMTPSTVNAYYNPSLNEIVFPAGILQPPYFDPQADDAFNYGAIGSFIGHELTHGFDDQGAKFDAAGNLTNWWSPTDLASFRQRAECVAKQYSGYTVLGDLHLNGKLVVGEAIADLGGIKLSYTAYLRSLQGKPRQTLDGLSPEQRFFFAFAESWAGVVRPEGERLRVTTNPHPPNRYRVDGTLADLPEFAQAFVCKPGDPMVRPAAERCAVW